MILSMGTITAQVTKRIQRRDFALLSMKPDGAQLMRLISSCQVFFFNSRKTGFIRFSTFYFCSVYLLTLCQPQWLYRNSTMSMNVEEGGVRGEAVAYFRILYQLQELRETHHTM